MYSIKHLTQMKLYLKKLFIKVFKKYHCNIIGMNNFKHTRTNLLSCVLGIQHKNEDSQEKFSGVNIRLAAITTTRIPWEWGSWLFVLPVCHIYHRAYHILSASGGTHNGGPWNLISGNVFPRAELASLGTNLTTLNAKKDENLFKIITLLCYNIIFNAMIYN